MDARESSEHIDEHIGFDRSRRELIMISSGVMALVSMVANIVVLFAAERSNVSIPPYTFILSIPCIAAYFAALRWKLDLGALFLCIGGTASLFVIFSLSLRVPLGIELAGLTILLLLSGFLYGPRLALILGMSDLVVLVSLSIIFTNLGQDIPTMGVASAGGVITVFTVTVFAVSKSIGELRENLRAKVNDIQQFIPRLVAKGGQVATHARGVHVMADQQREGSTRQSEALDETREAMHAILDASREISESAQAVFARAEKTTSNSEDVARQVASLSKRALRVEYIADGIKEIAGKSEILALNAALEGVKAGKAGEGFMLVADKMQQLSESIGGLSQQIKSLTREIRQSGDDTRRSAEETVELAQGATETGRKISVVTMAQQESTEKVAHSLDEIADVILETATASEKAQETTYALLEVAESLPEMLAELGAIEMGLEDSKLELVQTELTSEIETHLDNS